MSLLAKKVARLEWARALVSQLEQELAVDLNLAPARHSTRVLPILAPESEMDDRVGGPPDRNGYAPKRRRRRVTPEIRERVLALKREGKTIREIIAAIGFGKTSVERITRAAKVKAVNRGERKPSPRHGSPLTDDLIAQIVAGPKPGETAKQHQRELHVSAHTYYTIRKKHKAPRALRPNVSEELIARIKAGPQPGETT